MITQLESTFDLDCSSCPRSLSAYPLPSSLEVPLPTGNNKAVSTKPVHRHSGFAVVYGTERGSLHYRTFPLSKGSKQSVADDPITQASFSNVSSFDWAGTPGGLIQNGAVIGCIPAIANSTTDKNSATGSSTVSPSIPPNAFLLLRDDNRGAGGAHSSSPGAYSSSLVVLQHNTFTALTTVPSIQHNVYTTSSTTTSLGTLPRMTCASYHPNTGFVYAAGTSVCSVSPLVLYSVSMTLAMTMTSSTSPTSPLTHYLSSSVMTKTCTYLMSILPNFYFHAKNILPPPGARSTGSGCAEALTLICQGRVAVIPVGNSFWAVSGCPIPFRLHQLWRNMSTASVTSSEVTSLSSWEAFHDATMQSKSSMNDSSNMGEESKIATDLNYTEKILTFHQSSQVHPTIAVEIPTAKTNEIVVVSNHPSKVDDVVASLLFLANGRECAALEIFYNPNFYSTGTTIHSRTEKPKRGSTIHGTEVDEDEDDHEDDDNIVSKGLVGGPIMLGPPRHGIISMPSPILSAVGLPWEYTDEEGSKSISPMVAILTVDGTIDLRSFSCMAVPLSLIQVGTRPNDYFQVRSLPGHRVLALSYSGQTSLVSARLDSMQDLADRLMKLCIDAFGSNGFPRTLLAEAMNTSFSSTTYAGNEPTIASKTCLKQYLESVLGLDVNDDYGPALIRSPFQTKGSYSHHSFLLSATALLCLVCTQFSPPNAALANRSAKVCAQQMGIVSSMVNKGVQNSVVQLVHQVVESLLREASHFVLLTPSSSTILNTNIRSSKTGLNMDLTESALWLLRACGDHSRAIEVLQDYMTNPSLRNKATGSLASLSGQVSWTQGKFETYLMSHLSDLWRSHDEECSNIVLTASATRQLLENNPTMGLNIFTASLPQNKEQWELFVRNKQSSLDFSLCSRVIDLLKSTRPRILSSGNTENTYTSLNGTNDLCELPLDSGLALAVTYLEALIGVSTGRSKLNASATESFEEEVKDSETDLHDQLAFLLLEGIVSERSADTKEPDSILGKIYRRKLHRLFKWPDATLRSERLITVLPSSFLQERALLLGRLGRHKEALQILYCDLDNLEMALEYCDMRYDQRHGARHQSKGVDNDLNNQASEELGCPYMPLISVVLSSGPNPQRGITAAINILSLRRNVINLTAALGLLPAHLPFSTIAQPFLIPSLIENESEIRRLSMISSLLRVKYMGLKRKLIDCQLKSQMDMESVPMIHKLNLGNPLNVVQPVKLNPIHETNDCPEITVTKYFYSRYLVLKAEVANRISGRPIGSVTFHVAESSDESLVPSFTIPIQTLPSNATGVAWCILTTSPQRIDGVSTVSSELRYTILNVDPVSGAPLYFGSDNYTSISGRQCVVELDDIEIEHVDYSLGL